MREMTEKLGIETLTTAAESPFSNGIVERHNAILYEAMCKTIDDTGCQPDIGLAWALSAKNALQNQGGFSPNQLVFGYNANFPTVLTDAPPALESTTASDIVRKNLEALHSARENFIKSESSERVRRALRCKTRTYSDCVFQNGEKVFYRRKGFKGWKGPARVLGQEGKTVLLRHGTSYYRCDPCQLMKVANVSEDTTDRSSEQQQSTERAEQNRTNIDEGEDDDDDLESNPSDDDEVEHDDTRHSPSEDDENTVEQQIFESKDVKPTAKMYVEYKLNDGTEATAIVLSRQPKRGSKYNNWLNVLIDGDSEPSSV